MKTEYEWNVETYGKELANKYAAYAQDAQTRADAHFEKAVGLLPDLFEEIKKRLVMATLKFETEVRDPDGQGMTVRYTSNNIAESDSLLRAAYKDFRVSSFNAGKAWWEAVGLPGAERRHYGGYEPTNIDYEKPAVVNFHIDINFSYQSYRGSNGNEIGDAWLREGSDKWEIVWQEDLEKEREAKRAARGW